MFVRVPAGCVGVHHNPSDEWVIVKPGRHWVALAGSDPMPIGRGMNGGLPPTRFWTVDTRDQSQTTVPVRIGASDRTVVFEIRYHVDDPIKSVQSVSGSVGMPLETVVHTVARGIDDPTISVGALTDLIMTSLAKACDNFGATLVDLRLDTMPHTEHR